MIRSFARSKDCNATFASVEAFAAGVSGPRARNRHDAVGRSVGDKQGNFLDFCFSGFYLCFKLTLNWFKSHHWVMESDREEMVLFNTLLSEADSHLDQVKRLPSTHLVSAGEDGTIRMDCLNRVFFSKKKKGGILFFLDRKSWRRS